MNTWWILCALFLAIVLFTTLGYPALFIWYSKIQITEYSRILEFVQNKSIKGEAAQEYQKEQRSNLLCNLTQDIQNFDNVEQLISLKIFLFSQKQYAEFCKIKQRLDEMHTEIIRTP